MLRALLVIIIIRLSGSLLVPRTYRYFVFLLASLRVYVSYVALASERWAACFAGFASLSLLRFLTAPGGSLSRTIKLSAGIPGTSSFLLISIAFCLHVCTFLLQSNENEPPLPAAAVSAILFGHQEFAQRWWDMQEPYPSHSLFVCRWRTCLHANLLPLLV